MVAPNETVRSELEAAVITAAASAQFPDVEWVHEDDVCDCTFQRIGMWSNPYMARTLKVRFCCIWEELYKQFPQYVQRIPGWLDLNQRKEDGTEVYHATPMEWNGEADMPRAVWHRQIQALTGLDLDRVREMVKDIDPPKGR